MTAFPVAFAIRTGSAVVSFAIIRGPRQRGGLLFTSGPPPPIRTRFSGDYAALLAEGVAREAISVFRYPSELCPGYGGNRCFARGWEEALSRNHLLRRQPV